MAILDLDKAVKELFYWQFGNNPTNFTARLFDLMTKADLENAARLAKAFPVEAQAYLLWYHAPDANAFFKSWDLPRPEPQAVYGTGKDV